MICGNGTILRKYSTVFSENPLRGNIEDRVGATNLKILKELEAIAGFCVQNIAYLRRITLYLRVNSYYQLLFKCFEYFFTSQLITTTTTTI